MECYLDNIIIASNDRPKYIELSHNIFQILEKYQLKLSLNKMEFVEDSIDFLGYLIKDGKHFPTDDKINSIKA